MKKRNQTQQNILAVIEKNGETHIQDISDSMPDLKDSNRDYHIRRLKERGEIEKVKNGIYRIPEAINAQTRFREAREQFSSDVWFAEDNEQTINILMNTYREVLIIFQSWVLKHIASQEIDFEKQLIFIENFKWITMIADKLMKRWSLVHVGYDTNTRQAQEDAKAKTEQREKEALKKAPLEDTIMVVGKYDPEAMALIDCIPSSVKNTDGLENMTDEEKEKTAV